MYRLLADYLSGWSVPQLAVSTLFVAGAAEPAKLSRSARAGAFGQP